MACASGMNSFRTATDRERLRVTLSLIDFYANRKSLNLSSSVANQKATGVNASLPRRPAPDPFTAVSTFHAT